MHGVPEKYVNHATTDQLRVMWEVVLRDIKDVQSVTVANGVALALGGDKKK